MNPALLFTALSSFVIQGGMELRILDPVSVPVNPNTPEQ